MKYSPQEIMQYVREEDVKFIRLAFCDIYGKQKNISIMPSELSRAFEYGIAIDASAIDGFGDEARSDLLLHPDPETLAVLPWRPEHGRVIRLFCDITYPDGKTFECDTRSFLKKAIADAKKEGISFAFGAEMEFYLFNLDENGKPTRIPYDHAGYMDIAPDDRGENVRREICLTLEQMGIRPESSHHEQGPGQNEIDFRYSDALSAADNAMTFQTVVKTVADRNGLYADFSPKPLAGQPGSGLHINMSAQSVSGEDILPYLIAGTLEKVSDMTVFLNPSEKSYERFGSSKAPKYISWSTENRSQLVRVPAAVGEFRRAELRSPDPTANPYLAFALLIYAGLYGIKNRRMPPESVDINLFTAGPEILNTLKALPDSLKAAVEVMKNSSFIQELLPEKMIEIYSAGNSFRS
ncbi:glutamine synthetase family protein [Frisingicoccus sp.]|mgnify:CR=1 FL=1|uniref:glutamine synthetase family protein n=1 Tax=Frisingicoccus sp. TaxID=1918627 RepID=UPI0015C0B33C|nr:glutamine synthetase beta-grasp domain-containing protein [Frisingicoccus sp.]MEE0752578.1 glutamine synthetase family protein [Frisingicoccus sp.]